MSLYIPKAAVLRIFYSFWFFLPAPKVDPVRYSARSPVLSKIIPVGRTGSGIGFLADTSDLRCAGIFLKAIKKTYRILFWLYEDVSCAAKKTGLESSAKIARLRIQGIRPRTRNTSIRNDRSETNEQVHLGPGCGRRGFGAA
ncbi:MAG: hypothetical protein ABI447_39215, partial [Pseudomonas sp.]